MNYPIKVCLDEETRVMLEDIFVFGYFLENIERNGPCLIGPDEDSETNRLKVNL